MKKCCISDDIYIWMFLAEFSKPFHGILVRFRLSDVKSDLMLKILPVICHRIIHMYRIPDNISQKAHCIFMKFRRIFNNNTSAFFFIMPLVCWNNFPCGTVNDLPPAFHIIPCIYLHQFFRNTLHQRNFQLAVHRRMESSHNIALLHLIRIGPGPYVIFTCRIIR